MKRAKTSRYVKVMDGRGKAIDGLWIRNGIYYLQLRVPLADGGTKPVRKRLDATSTLGAKKEAESLRVQRDTGKAPAVKIPYLRDALNVWLDVYAQSHPVDSTRARRRAANVWLDEMGDLKLNAVKPSKIRGVIAGRMKNEDGEGYANNTIRSEYDVLNQLFEREREDGTIHSNPCEFVKPPPKEDAERVLFTPDEVRKFAESMDSFKCYGARGHDLALLIAFTGVRVSEALKLKWMQIDFEKRLLHIGRKSKGKYARSVNFNPDLEALLKEMHERRLPDSDWVFASYHGGCQHAQKKPTSWAKAKEATGLQINPHDLRHFFISRCVMSGIDFKTIAEWVGHKDASMTAKVYSHLLDDHKEKKAAQVNFGPRVVEGAA